ncbi:hypothetical protein [Bacillus cereus group sp. BfR-BA-01356]|uniref:hypothetical protein n=1 Tax=Bacillus cereus group sp. BfR-BA-01356 TaxID=2920319 RepID=UPI001F591088
MAAEKKQKEKIQLDIKIATPKQALETRKKIMDMVYKGEIESAVSRQLVYALQGASTEHRSIQEGEKLKLEKEKIAIQERAVVVSEEVKLKLSQENEDLEDQVHELREILRERDERGQRY